MQCIDSTATTRPHLAAAMVRLASPALGEVVVDLGCGMGTIMSEAAQHNCRLRDPGPKHSGGGDGNTRYEAQPLELQSSSSCEAGRGGVAVGGGGGGRAVLGGDVVASVAALAVANRAAAAPSLCYDVCVWSMEHLPLRTASQGGK